MTMTCWSDLYNLFRDWQIPMFLLTAAGIFFVIQQLGQLRRQNALLEASIKQTYRPFGIFYGNEPAVNGKQENVFSFVYIVTSQTFNIPLRLACSVSSGVLILRLFRPILSKVRIENAIRYLLEMTEIKSPYIDVQLTNGQVYQQTLAFEKEITSEKFLYVFAVYEDQNSNLYGTVLGLELRWDQHTGLMRTKDARQYHLFFDAKEKDALESMIKMIDVSAPSNSLLRV